MNKLLLIIISLIFFISCSGEKSEARISLENYLIALKNEEFQNAYQFLSNDFKNECEYNDFKKKASINYDALKHSRIIYSGESESDERVRIEFIIKIDEKEINFFDLQIMDPYSREETAIFLFESNEWKLDNLIWPIDWCEELE
tara:strand:- start:721 stop:1152 length:432 start_codon:yes stop_codon:yes gene_type:complete